MPREWDTPLREPWNPIIKSCLKAVDQHTQLYLETGENWHSEQAQHLRNYVHGLKQWIHKQEGKI